MSPCDSSKICTPLGGEFCGWDEKGRRSISDLSLVPAFGFSLAKGSRDK
jgi:hypothetical protein